MKDKIITSKKIIFSQSVVKDQSKDVSDFLAERFYSVNQSHNCAIIIGSSLAHQVEDMEHDAILDSSGVLVTVDKIGIIDGARIAVTDGLGGGNGNQDEDEAIHRVAYSTCEAFLDSNNNIDTTLDLISQSTSTSAKHAKTKKREDAHASLAAFSYKYNQQEGYSAEFANIGDGLIIILDKQYKIKQTLCARHIYRGFGQWTPPAVQTLKISNRNNILIRKTLELAEGDIIVTMTDGIWGELKSNLNSQTQVQRDIEIEPESFESLFDGLIGLPNPSSFDIARIITNQAMSQSVERRNTLVQLINELEQQHFEEKSIHTINELLVYFDKTGKHEIAKTLKSILFEQALNDGIIYFDNIEIPLNVVMQDLKSRTVGDCSTINVTRIPYHLDELIRCFITHPEQHQALVPHFKVSIKSVTDLEEAFKRLSLEEIQSDAECKLSEARFEPAFKKETINKTQAILTHYFHLTTHFDKTMSYKKWLTYLGTYITQETSLKKNDIKLLLSMLDSQIKPKTGFFHTFMGENQSKFYKAFHKQIELEFLDKIDDKKNQLN